MPAKEVKVKSVSMIAGGTGITPMLQLVRAVRGEGVQERVAVQVVAELPARHRGEHQLTAAAGGGLRVHQRPLAEAEQLPHRPQLVRRHARLVLQLRLGLGPGHRGLGQAEAGEQAAVVDPGVVSLVPEQCSEWGILVGIRMTPSDNIPLHLTASCRLLSTALRWRMSVSCSSLTVTASSFTSPRMSYL